MQVGAGWGVRAVHCRSYLHGLLAPQAQLGLKSCSGLQHGVFSVPQIAVLSMAAVTHSMARCLSAAACAPALC